MNAVGPAALPVLDPNVTEGGLLEAAADGVLVVRMDGSIGFVNRMAEKMFGYDRSELLDQSIEVLIPATLRDAHVRHRAAFVAANRARAMGELAAVEAVRKNGETLPVEISLSPVETASGRVVLAIVRDVTRHRRLEAELRHASTHDALTGLFNRAHLDAVRASLERARFPVGVVLADIDGLKQVNEVFGHGAGDQLIRRCAVVLRTACPPSAVVARHGGAEFAVLLPRCTRADVDATVDRIRAELASHNGVSRGTTLAMSIGGAIAVDGSGISDAMRRADLRTRADKETRRPPAPT